MSQSVEVSASAAEVRSGNGEHSAGNGTRAPASTSAILFNELVLSHFRWFTLSGRFGEFGGLPVGLAPAGWPPKHEPTPEERKEAEDRYYEKLKQFTDSEGEIIAAFWSVKVPSGIVMTVRPHGRVLNVLRGPTISLHRASTWLTGSDSQVAELLHHCDTLGNKAAHILTRTPKRVAMTWIFSTESYLLGVIEGRSCGPITPPSQTNGSPEPEKGAGRKSASEVVAMSVAGGMPPGGLTTESTAEAVEDFVARGRSEIIEIEKYYDRAATNAARFLYFWGMLCGAVIAGAAAVLIALIAAASFDVIKLDSTETRFFFACYAAGALGAIVSVLTRMRSNRFVLDYEVGRMPAFWLGSFRPFIGAIFGLVVYFALQSELLQLQQPDEKKAFFFFTFLAFAAGFSERLTHVILGGAERTVAGTLEQGDKALGEESTTEQVSADGTTTRVTTRKKSGQTS